MKEFTYKTEALLAVARNQLTFMGRRLEAIDWLMVYEEGGVQRVGVWDPEGSRLRPLTLRGHGEGKTLAATGDGKEAPRSAIRVSHLETARVLNATGVARILAVVDCRRSAAGDGVTWL